MKKLKHIEINIWKACNNKCKFCMSSKPSLWDIKFSKFDIIRKSLNEYYNNWYRSVWFLWWDISIHPNVLEIIKCCREIWYQSINIISNSMRFSDFSFAYNIVKKWLTRINISIHSHISYIEDDLTQVKWWLQKKLRAIDNFSFLYKKWILQSPISINIVVNKKNYLYIVETVLYFFKEKNIKDIRINFIRLSDDVKENWDLLKISYSEFLPYLKKLIYLSLKYNIRITFDTFPPCIFYLVSFKNYKYIINKFLWEKFDHINEILWLNKETSFNWKDRKANELKAKFKQCSNCFYENVCEWVWKEYDEIYWNKEFIPIKL